MGIADERITLTGGQVKILGTVFTDQTVELSAVTRDRTVDSPVPVRIVLASGEDGKQVLIRGDGEVIGVGG